MGAGSLLFVKQFVTATAQCVANNAAVSFPLKSVQYFAAIIFIFVLFTCLHLHIIRLDIFSGHPPDSEPNGLGKILNFHITQIYIHIYSTSACLRLRITINHCYCTMK